MKRTIAALLCLFFLVSTSNAWAAGVPEEVLHQAIMTLTWEDDQGECWVEGHTVLGTEETDSSATTYALVTCMNYGFLAGLLTDTGGGFVIPMTFTFDRSADGYVLQYIQQPEDGEHYWPSLEAMMPRECLDRLVENDEEYRLANDQQMQHQAQLYLDGIGRSESVGDWRELNLQLPNILTVASNLTTGFTPPYPYWTTEKEQVENGERYIYKRTWEADGATGDTQTYTMPDGSELIYDGTTGLAILTKTRWADGEVLETITIKAELYDLYIGFSDAYGVKEYHFSFDGQTYHQPTITESGECRISYPSFDMQAIHLPK